MTGDDASAEHELRLLEAKAAAMCSHPALPKDFKPLCLRKDAGASLARLGKIYFLHRILWWSYVMSEHMLPFVKTLCWYPTFQNFFPAQGQSGALPLVRAVGVIGLKMERDMQAEVLVERIFLMYHSLSLLSISWSVLIALYLASSYLRSVNMVTKSKGSRNMSGHMIRNRSTVYPDYLNPWFPIKTPRGLQEKSKSKND